MTPDRPSDGSPEQRAYERGLKAAEIQTTLSAHEKRLLAINGSIERTGKALVEIHECLDDLVADRRTQAAVEKALKSAVEDAAKNVQAAASQTVSTRQFWIGVIGLALVIVGLYLGAR